MMDAGRLGPIFKGFKAGLKDPLRLRFFLGGAMAVAWYAAVYLPTSTGIEESSRRRSAALAHATAAREIESLRAELDRVKDRLPRGTDPNEWVEYVLAGLRERPVRLLKLEPKGVRKHGPLSVVTLQIDLSGSFAELDEVLTWLEDNPRLFRVDAAALDRGRGSDRDLILRLTVLGVMG